MITVSRAYYSDCTLGYCLLLGLVATNEVSMIDKMLISDEGLELKPYRCKRGD